MLESPLAHKTEGETASLALRAGDILVATTLPLASAHAIYSPARSKSSRTGPGWSNYMCSAARRTSAFTLPAVLCKISDCNADNLFGSSSRPTPSSSCAANCSCPKLSAKAQHHRLRTQIHPKALVYPALHKILQALHIGGSCAAPVDERKRVFAADANRAENESLRNPACSISQAAANFTCPSPHRNVEPEPLNPRRFVHTRQSSQRDS